MQKFTKTNRFIWIDIPIKKMYRCLTLAIILISSTSLFAQDPCTAAQPWSGGATWNVDGSIDDSPNGGDGIENQARGGIIRCGSAAETQSNIQPLTNYSVYDSNDFDLNAYVNQIECIDPAIVDENGVADPAIGYALPQNGDDIIWIQFDVRANVENYQFQIISNDIFCWALFYLDADGNLADPDGQALADPDCDKDRLVFNRCGTNFANQWNNLLFDTPSPEEITNFYVAAWRKSGNSAFSVVFKARFGCDTELDNVTCAADNSGPVCEGDDVMLDGTLFNGKGTETFSWKDESLTEVATTLDATIAAPSTDGTYTYTLEVYDGADLKSTCTTDVVVDPPYDAGDNGTERFCEGDGSAIDLDASGAGGSGGTWADTDGSGVDLTDPTSVDFSLVSAGSYTFTYTVTPSGGNTCPGDSSTVEVTIDPPYDAGDNGTERFCEGDGSAIDLDASGAGGSGGTWADTDGSGVDLTDPTSVDFSLVSAGSYTFTYTVTPSGGNTCPGDSSTVEVTIDPPYDAGDNGTERFCEGDGSAIDLDASGAGGSGGTWADTDGSGVDLTDPTSVDFSLVSAGSYTFTYTVTPSGGNTCPGDSSTVEVTIDPPYDAGENGTERFCEGDGSAIDLDASGAGGSGGTWADTDGSGVDLTDPTSVDFSLVSAGSYTFTYTVTPSGGNTCPGDSSTVEVTIDPPYDAGDNGTERFCEGDGSAIDLDASGAGGSGGTWADTDGSGVDLTDPTSVDFSLVSAGSYTFTYTVTPSGGNTCPGDSSTVEVTIDPPYDAGENGTERFCEGDGSAIDLDASGAGGSGGTWADTDGSGVDLTDPTSVDFSLVSAGSYTFTYTVTPSGGNTCPGDSSTVEVTIDPPYDAGDNGTERFCEGDGSAIDLDASGAGGSGGTWADTDGSGVDLTDPTSVDFSLVSAGSYTFTYTVTPSGGNTCPGDSSTVEVTIDPPYDAGDNGTERFCEGDGSAIDLDASGAGGSGGTWADTDGSGVDLTDPTSVDFSLVSAGSYTFTYTVTPSGGNTCPGDSSTVEVTIDPPYDAGENGTERFCEGDGSAIDLDASGAGGSGGTWADTDGSGVDLTDPTSVDFSLVSAGSYTFTYTVTPSGGNTCPGDSSTVEVTIDTMPPCNITGDTTVCLQDAHIYSAPAGDYEYSWSVTGGTIVGANDEQNVTVVAATEGNLNIELTLTNGSSKCTNTCDVDVTVYDCCEDETAFAYNTTYDGINNLCFLDVNDKNVLRENRWGWTLDNLDLAKDISDDLGYQYNSYTFNLYVGNGGGSEDDCDPTDGPGELVGTVTITRDGDDISITYDLNDPTDTHYYSLDGLHANLGCTQFAKKIKGKREVNTTAPGQYNVKGNANGENWVVLTIPASEIDCLGDLYAIFHAEVNICAFEPVDNNPVIASRQTSMITNDVKEKTLAVKAYPVPFNDKVTIEYNFDFETDVTIEVVDLRGRVFETITNKRYSKNTVDKVVIDMSKIKDQLFFVRVSTNNGSIVKQIVSDTKK